MATTWISHFLRQDVWPPGYEPTHTHTHMHFRPRVHTQPHGPSKVMVCVQWQSRESPLMSGSPNDIIAVDGACWGILFHTIGMLQTSARTTHCRWWQKLVLTPELSLDAFDKKPQHVDSSSWQENCSYFSWREDLWVFFVCFFITKTDMWDLYQRDGAALLLWTFEIQAWHLRRLLEMLSDLKYSLL